MVLFQKARKPGAGEGQGSGATTPKFNISEATVGMHHHHDVFDIFDLGTENQVPSFAEPGLLSPKFE